MSTAVLPYRILTSTSNTLEWLGLRQGGCGASESAAILGQSAWGTPRSIYNQKINPNVVDETTDLMEFGHLAEPLIEQFMNNHPERYGHLGQIVPAEGLLQSIEWPWLLGTLDRELLTPEGERVPLELKSIGDYTAAEWRGGTDDDEDAEDDHGGELTVPPKYTTQVMQQMAITGAPFGYIAAWLGKGKLVVIRIERDEAFIEKYLIGLVGDFWTFNVEARNPPPLTVDDDLWAAYPGDTSLPPFEADEDLIDNIGKWRIAATDARELKAELKQLKFEILDTIGNHVEVIDPLHGKVIHTLKPQKTARKIERLTLELKYPDAWAECVSEPGLTRVHRATKVAI